MEDAAERRRMATRPETSQEAGVWGLGFPRPQKHPRESKMPGSVWEDLEDQPVPRSCLHGWGKIRRTWE